MLSPSRFVSNTRFESHSIRQRPPRFGELGFQSPQHRKRAPTGPVFATTNLQMCARAPKTGVTSAGDVWASARVHGVTCAWPGRCTWRDKLGMVRAVTYLPSGGRGHRTREHHLLTRHHAARMRWASAANAPQVRFQSVCRVLTVTEERVVHENQSVKRTP